MVAAQASLFLPPRENHRHIFWRITATIYVLVYNASEGITNESQSYLKKAGSL